MPNQAKLFQVDDLKAKFESAKSAALVDYQGLSADQISTLRRAITDQGGNMEVAKNTLVQRALEALGITLPETLTGPTAVIFANTDEVAPLKEAEKSQKKVGKPVFKLGVFQLKLITQAELTKFLALPSRSHLLAMLLGGLANPLQRLAYGLTFHQHKFLLTLKALHEKKEATA